MRSDLEPYPLPLLGGRSRSGACIPARHGKVLAWSRRREIRRPESVVGNSTHGQFPCADRADVTSANRHSTRGRVGDNSAKSRQIWPRAPRAHTDQTAKCARSRRRVCTTTRPAEKGDPDLWYSISVNTPLHCGVFTVFGRGCSRNSRLTGSSARSGAFLRVLRLVGRRGGRHGRL